MSATFIEKIMNKDFAAANTEFGSMIAAKVEEAMDAEKVVLAAEIYHGIDREEIEEEFNDETEELEDED